MEKIKATIQHLNLFARMSWSVTVFRNCIVMGLLFHLSVFAAELPNKNAVYDPDIHTVQVYKSGFDLSAPIIQLHSGEKITISFDDLNPGIRRFKYTVLHCQSDWNSSSAISPIDYLNGFREENIDQFEYSYNTTVPYTHYTGFFPTVNMQPRISGNYLLVVYEEEPSRIVFTWRIMVVEVSPVVATGTVSQSSRMDDHLTRQQIDVMVKLNGFSVVDISREIKVVIQQNGRYDNALLLGKPRFIRGDELDYRFDEAIAFDAGNQFRSFDIKSLRYQSERIAKIAFDSVNQVTLVSDLPRTFKQYVFEEELNGKFFIKNEEHADNSNTEADYAWVHFFLPYPVLLTTGQFFIVGELTRWELDDNSRMSFNFDRRGYELKLFLKQGYYNYLVLFKENNTTAGDVGFIEGNHWETENDYSILTYLCENGSLYDRLVAVNFINSIRK